MQNNPKLTDVERLILANQYRILSYLEKDDSHKLMSDSLLAGHPFIYNQIFAVLGENLSEADTEFVLTILDIYGALRDSYSELDDKSGIDQSAVRFPGFDGNNEVELLVFATDLLNNGRYRQTLGEDAIDSHFPTVAGYARMIQAWYSLGRPHYPYNKKAIQTILAARPHPTTS